MAKIQFSIWRPSAIFSSKNLHNWSRDCHRVPNPLFKSDDFYRVMLCIPRTMLSKDVCPSVTRRYSVETAKHIIKLFPPSGSHTIVVLSYQAVWQYSDGNPSNGGVECGGGYEKNCDFLPISHFISQWYKIRPWFL